MVQVYFALVLSNLVGGLILARPAWNRSLGVFDNWFLPFEHRIVQGVLGALTFVSGFLALVFVYPGDPLFLGDLLPALSALLIGTVFLVKYYQKTPSPAEGSRVEDFLVQNRMIVGLAGLVFGLVHFVSPGVIFL